MVANLGSYYDEEQMHPGVICIFYFGYYYCSKLFNIIYFKMKQMYSVQICLELGLGFFPVIKRIIKIFVAHN